MEKKLRGIGGEDLLWESFQGGGVIPARREREGGPGKTGMWGAFQNQPFCRTTNSGEPKENSRNGG